MGNSNKDAAYGGFVVSNNVLVGRPVGYSFREQSDIPQLNGWTLYSVDDDQEYIERAENFRVVAASTVAGLVPIMLEIFEAPNALRIDGQLPSLASVCISEIYGFTCTHEVTVAIVPV